MLYDTVRSPNAPYHPPKISIPTGKDTIESTQQRLKREMLDKVQNKGLELPHESYVAVVQVGKYVFLAVMLPVYLCVYGVPRWFLVNALPQVFAVVKNQSLTIGRFIHEMSKRVADLMKGMLEQLIGDALRLSRDRAKNFWKRFSQKMSKISQNISHVSEEIIAQIQKIKKAFARASGKLYGKAEHNARMTNKWVTDHAIKIAKQVGEKSLKTLHVIDRTAFTPLMKVLIYPFQKLAQFNQVLKAKALDQAQKIKKQLKRVTDPVLALLKRGLEQSKKTANRLIEPVISWVTEKKEVVEAYLQKMKKAVIDPIVDAIAVIRAKIEPPITATLNFVKQSILIVPVSIKRSVKFAWKKVPQRFKDKRHSFSKLGHSMKQLGKGVVQGLVEISVLGKKGLIKVVELLMRLVKAMKSFVQWAFKQLVALPRKIKHLLVATFNVISFIMARITFAGHVVVALVWVACVYSFQLVRQMTNPIQKSS